MAASLSTAQFAARAPARVASSTSSVARRAALAPQRASAARMAPRTSAAAPLRVSSAVEVAVKPTAPIDGQKTGTSGLRKKVAVFMGENYLANWVQVCPILSLV